MKKLREDPCMHHIVEIDENHAYCSKCDMQLIVYWGSRGEKGWQKSKKGTHR